MNSQSEQHDNGQAPDPELERTLVDYLRGHPDFFVRNPGVLGQIDIPHHTGEAVSLVQRQVETLRRQADGCHSRLEAFIAVARENEALNDKLHRLTLTLIDTLDFGEVLTVLQERLQADFGADAVELRVFSSAESNEETNPGLDGFRALVDGGRPACGPLPKEQRDYLFGADGDRIASAALLPLTGEGLLGLLAIGSQDPERYRPGMATDYLARMGEIVGKTLEVLSEPGF